MFTTIYRPPRSGLQLAWRRAGGTQLRSKILVPRETTVTNLQIAPFLPRGCLRLTRARGFAQKVVDCSAHSIRPTHQATLAALVPASILSLAAHYLSRMGSSRPLGKIPLNVGAAPSDLCKDRGNRSAGKACLLHACEHHGARSLQRCFLLHCWCRKCPSGSQRVDWQLSCRRAILWCLQLPLSKTPVEPPRAAR